MTWCGEAKYEVTVAQNEAGCGNKSWNSDVLQLALEVESIISVTPSLADDGQWRVSGYFIR